MLWGVVVLGTVIYQLTVTIDKGASVANFLSFFTIESNILASVVLISSGLRPRDSLPPWWDALRGAATLYMFVTGIIYNTLLLNVPTGLDYEWINTVLHRAMPLLMVLDWLIDPPRRRIQLRTALLWLIFPLAYAAYTLVRGPFVDFYPYPFVDPRLDGGYGRVVIYVVIVAVVCFALAALLVWAGNRLRDRRSGADPGPGGSAQQPSSQ